MNSNLLKICLASLLALSFTACGDDDNSNNNGGNGGETISCTAGEKKCSPDNTALLVCNAAGNAWDKGDPCAFGCENNACKSDPNGGGNETVCTPKSIECHNGKLLKCNADGSAIDEEKCDYGCEKGQTTCNTEKCTTDAIKCNDDQTAALTCNANGTWDEEPCTYGCNSGACVQIESLEACDPEVLAECQTKFAEEFDGDITCYVDETDGPVCVEKCTSLGSTTVECDDEEYFDISSYMCIPIGDDGTGTWFHVEVLEECDFGCNDDLTACAEPLVEDQYEKCDSATRADRCDGNIISYCDGRYGVVLAGHCKEGHTCVELDNDGSVWADCFKDTDTCTADSTVCKTDDESGIDVLTTSVCKPSKDDPTKKYIIKKNEACPTGTCADATSCEPPLVEDQGKECDAETRAGRCDGSILSVCTYLDLYDYLSETMHVGAMDCADKEAVCDSGTINGAAYANCFTEDDKCENVGDEIQKCDPDYGSIDTYVCTELTGGKYYVLDTYDECDFGCAEGATECGSKLVEDQGETCTKTERPDACDLENNILSYCSTNKVVARKCGADKTCTVLSDGSANCFSAEDECDTVDDTKNVCDGTKYSDKYVCLAAEGDSGKKYWVYTGYESCKTECVEATGLCKE